MRAARPAHAPAAKRGHPSVLSLSKDNGPRLPFGHPATPAGSGPPLCHLALRTLTLPSPTAEGEVPATWPDSQRSKLLN